VVIHRVHPHRINAGAVSQHAASTGLITALT
jgi:hypothetical protein